MRKFTILLAFLIFAGMQAAFAQLEVRGTVTDASDGTKLPGVSVVVQGTTVGTVTDVEGKFMLQVPEGYNELIFSFVGMISKEVAIDGRTVIDVTLEPDVLGLDEVVVTAIGISREKKALGYSVQDVGGEELNRGQNTQLINALNGRVAGVQVTNSSGAAGAGTYVQIRGATSIIGNNQPLFVVDGVPIDNSTSVANDGFNDDVGGVARSNRAIDLNPEDIESVSVLKGGAATALYGSRATNGAIIITTKKGKATPGKKVNVNFSQSVGFDQISQRPDLQKQYAQGFGGWGSGNALSWGPWIDTMGYSKDPEVWTNPGFDVDGALVSKNSPYYNPELGEVNTYDHYDFFRTGVTSNTNISFSGGSDISNFYASASYMNQNGIVPNNDFQRLTALIKGETRISKKITVSGQANYIESGGDRIQQGSNVSGVMLGLLRTPPTFDNSAGWKFGDGSQRNYRSGGGYDNPYWTVNENLYQDKVKRVIGNVAFNYLPTDWISITWRVGADMYSRLAKDHFAIGSRAFPTGQVYVDQFQSRDFNSDFLINFNRELSEDFRLNLTLGHNIYEQYGSRTFATANGLELPNFYNLSNTSTISAGEATTRVRRAGLFFDLGLDFKSMLFLNVTGRNDWTTTLPEQNNSRFYPSVNAGFVFTELPGLKDNPVLGFGKIRASWAQTANDTDPYNTATYFTQAFPSDGWVLPLGLEFPLLGKAGFTLSDLQGNADLLPETSTIFELGAELKFFNNRLGVDVSYFNTTTEDILLPVAIAASSGFTDLFLNAAEMTNKGWEIIAYGTPVKTQDFSWDIMVNFTSIDNTVDKLAENIEDVFLGGFVDPQIRAVAGEPYRSIYGFDWIRDDNGNVLINDDPESSGYGFPMGDYERMVSLGKVDPDFTMGITNTFRFKGLMLSFLFDWKSGGQMWNGTKGAMYYFGTHGDQVWRNPEDLYVFEGVKESTGETNNIEVVRDANWHLLGEGSGFTGPTVQFIEETSWFRLRELTLSYEFGSGVIGENGFFKNLSIYFTGKNLLLFTDYTGVDPETNLLGNSNAQGMDYFNMPGTKSYIVGLRAGF